MLRYASALLFSIACSAPALAGDREFGGYDCTDDCSGHKAGYEYAERNGFTSEADCSGNQSFYEGCKTFLDNPYRRAGEDDDGNEIED